MKKYPTNLEIEKELTYNPETGIFTRNKPDNRSKQNYAGTINSNGYIVISLKNKYWFAHRLAWTIYYNEQPNSNIDHIDMNKANNAISNLRLVTKSETARNTSIRRDNKIGITGLHWHKKANKWMVSIALDGKNLYLGLYESLLDACCVRKTAEINMRHRY